MDLVGVGLYTIHDAARITRAAPREIRRWMFGYTFKTRGGELATSPPLWHSSIERDDAIGFRDLLELRIVKEFVAHGVHLSVVRAALANARALIGSDYPFTRHRFLTDGRRIFHEALKSSENPLTDVAARQLVFETIIRPSLYAGIEYSRDGKARRWYPMPRTKAVVLDPEVSFGAPTLNGYGIPVETVTSAVRAEGSEAAVARMFDIPRAAVSAAMKYEGRLAA